MMNMNTERTENISNLFMFLIHWFTNIPFSFLLSKQQLTIGATHVRDSTWSISLILLYRDYL